MDWPLAGGAHNCYVDGNYLYSIGHDEGGVQIFDLTNIESPELAGFYSTYYYHDIYVKNGIAYAAGIYGASCLCSIIRSHQCLSFLYGLLARRKGRQ